MAVALRAGDCVFVKGSCVRAGLRIHGCKDPIDLINYVLSGDSTLISSIREDPNPSRAVRSGSNAVGTSGNLPGSADALQVPLFGSDGTIELPVEQSRRLKALTPYGKERTGQGIDVFISARRLLNGVNKSRCVAPLFRRSSVRGRTYPLPGIDIASQQAEPQQMAFESARSLIRFSALKRHGILCCNERRHDSGNPRGGSPCRFELKRAAGRSGGC
jgi:hypothetical protein